jgi:hypothetical protein
MGAVHPRVRTALGLVAFVAIQAMSVIVCSSNWRHADNPGNGRLLALFGLHFVFVMLAGGVAALFWGGNEPPTDRPASESSGPPPGPPPSWSPAGVPVGPRTPSPLAAHAEVG